MTKQKVAADPLQNAMLTALRDAKIEVVTKPRPLSFLSSGSLTWDIKMGGGFVRGAINNIWGPQSCGKTTLALCASAHIARHGGNVVYINAEKIFDETWARLMGCPFGDDPDAEHFALVNQSLSMEEIFNLVIGHPPKVQGLLGNCDLIVIDSVAAMIPAAEVEADAGDRGYPLHAGTLSFNIRRLTHGLNPLEDNQTALLFINQARDKINPSQYEDPLKQTGGWAFRHAAANTFRMWPKKRLPDDKTKPQLGHMFQMKDSGDSGKNKVVATGNAIEIPIGAFLGARGYLRGVELTTLGKQYELFTDADGKPSNKGYLYFNGQKLGNGEVQTWDALENNPDVAQALEAAIWAKVREG